MFKMIKILNRKNFTLAVITINFLIALSFFLPITTHKHIAMSLIGQAQAQTTTTTNPTTTIGQYIANIVNTYVVPLASIASLVVITYAGIQYMTSQGSPDALSKAKELILGAVLGLGLIF